MVAPLSVETRNELGKFYLKAGRGPEAATQFKASVASIPNAPAYDFLGDIAVLEKQPDVAEQDFRQVLSLEPYDPEAHFGLARILESRGQLQQALAEFRNTLSVDPLNAEAKAAGREGTWR